MWRQWGCVSRRASFSEDLTEAAFCLPPSTHGGRIGLLFVSVLFVGPKVLWAKQHDSHGAGWDYMFVVVLGPVAL